MRNSATAPFPKKVTGGLGVCCTNSRKGWVKSQLLPANPSDPADAGPPPFGKGGLVAPATAQLTIAFHSQLSTKKPPGKGGFLCTGGPSSRSALFETRILICASVSHPAGDTLDTPVPFRLRIHRHGSGVGRFLCCPQLVWPIRQKLCENHLDIWMFRWG